MLIKHKMIPSIGTPIESKDILSGLCSKKAVEEFERVIKRETNRRYVLLTNSGTTAYFLILRALKRFSDRKEVILPDYTAPSLILPIRKAGLTPRLCDIDLGTFNMELSTLSEVVGKDTLAITIVHMFGLPTRLKQEYNGTFLIEDLASALGSKIEDRPVGSFGDVSFVSFNRGKNLSTLAGGAIFTDREDIYKAILEEKGEYLNRPDLNLRMGIVLKTIALSLAVRPWFYSLFRGIIAGFKYTEIHQDFASYGYTPFQAGIGFSIFKKSSHIFERRYKNGLYLHKALSNLKGVTLPAIPDDSTPVFNQFPLLISDNTKRDIIHEAIIREGIETTILYPDPIHRVYNDLGCDVKTDPFPHAAYLSKRLLLIPTHPYIKEDDLKKAVDIILRYL